MGTKMKGLFKGLRYISHIFEEEKEEEIQIGFPTDVKHVAHIGWDGPSSVDSSPSWMKEFKTPTAFQSAPLLPPVDSRGNAEIQWVSEDSKRSNRSAPNSPCSDHFPEKAKSSRRHSLTDNNLNDSPKRKEKSRSSRRSKDTSGGSIIISSRLQQDCNSASSSPARALLPGVPKKTRRKKSKDLNADGSSRSRSKGGPSSGILTSPFHERDGGSPLSSIVNGEEVEC